MGIEIGGDLGNLAKKAEETVRSVGEAVVAVAAAPVVVAGAVVSGGSVDAEVKRINELVVDAVSATSYAANVPNFLVVDLAKAVGGEAAASVAIAAVAGNVVQTNLFDMVSKQLNRPDLKPEDLPTLPLSAVLAAALLSAAEQLRAVARPVPDLVQLLLDGKLPAELLKETRYVVGQVGLTLPEVINGVQEFMGNHHAVALPGIIVFSVEPDQSRTALHWWCHELEHIAQYNRHGVEGFAARYLNDFTNIEKEADDRANSLAPLSV